jgi:hypothetical protein
MTVARNVPGRPGGTARPFGPRLRSSPDSG